MRGHRRPQRRSGGARLERTTPAALVDVVASTLIADPVVRQRLLETTDVSRRINLVSSEIAEMTARLATPATLN